MQLVCIHIWVSGETLYMGSMMTLVMLVYFWQIWFSVDLLSLFILASSARYVAYKQQEK